MNKILILSLLLSSCATPQHSRQLQSLEVPYCGCLLFIDDVKTADDLSYAIKFHPDFLLRSWYRWGEPSPDKSYSRRRNVMSISKRENIGIGGGISLSFVNDRDLANPDFDKLWLSVNLDGSLVIRKNRKFGSLSSPSFRAYLIRKLMEQVHAGAQEIHIGESNGEIHFDDWTLGLKGNAGFIQWLQNKYTNQPSPWWIENFGQLGINILQNRNIDRATILKFTEEYKETFACEFGKPGSWNGQNNLGNPSFLADLYTRNLESFLSELRKQLDQEGYKDVVIDVWGFADWMPKMSIQPNAYLSTPPDERWGLNWSTDETFDLSKNRDRIKSIMQEQMKTSKMIPVIYMIDHSKPFDDFKKLPDERQAEITKFFSVLTMELGANFVFRSYSNDRTFLGKKTEQIIMDECRQRKQNFCPQNR